MTAEELNKQVHDYIDQGLYQEALSALCTALPGEIQLDEDHLLKLMVRVSGEGCTFEEACAMWWALPPGDVIDANGCVTPKGEAMLPLHTSLLNQMRQFGVDAALGYTIDPFDVAVPPTVVLALAKEAAKALGVHHP